MLWLGQLTKARMLQRSPRFEVFMYGRTIVMKRQLVHMKPTRSMSFARLLQWRFEWRRHNPRSRRVHVESDPNRLERSARRRVSVATRTVPLCEPHVLRCILHEHRLIRLEDRYGFTLCVQTTSSSSTLTPPQLLVDSFPASAFKPRDI